MRYRDINPPNEWGEAPDQGIAVTPSTEMYLFALLPSKEPKHRIEPRFQAGGWSRLPLPPMLDWSPPQQSSCRKQISSQCPA